MLAMIDHDTNGDHALSYLEYLSLLVDLSSEAPCRLTSTDVSKNKATFYSEFTALACTCKNYTTNNSAAPPCVCFSNATSSNNSNSTVNQPVLAVPGIYPGEYAYSICQNVTNMLKVKTNCSSPVQQPPTVSSLPPTAAPTKFVSVMLPPAYLPTANTTTTNSTTMTNATNTNTTIANTTTSTNTTTANTTTATNTSTASPAGGGTTSPRTVTPTATPALNIVSTVTLSPTVTHPRGTGPTTLPAAAAASSSNSTSDSSSSSNRSSSAGVASNINDDPNKIAIWLPILAATAMAAVGAVFWYQKQQQKQPPPQEQQLILEPGRGEKDIEQPDIFKPTTTTSTSLETPAIPVDATESTETEEGDGEGMILADEDEENGESLSRQEKVNTNSVTAPINGTTKQSLSQLQLQQQRDLEVINNRKSPKPQQELSVRSTVESDTESSVMSTVASDTSANVARSSLMKTLDELNDEHSNNNDDDGDDIHIDDSFAESSLIVEENRSNLDDAADLAKSCSSGSSINIFDDASTSSETELDAKLAVTAATSLPATKSLSMEEDSAAADVECNEWEWLSLPPLGAGKSIENDATTFPTSQDITQEQAAEFVQELNGLFL